LSLGFRLSQQRRLADSGRPLDRQQAAAAKSGTDQRLDRRLLGIAFEEPKLRRERSFASTALLSSVPHR
jgi:hypothetical protein